MAGPSDPVSPSSAPATVVERSDGLVTVTFNRPHRKNALNADNWTTLSEVVAELETDPGTRALILTGADGNFSSGADLSSESSQGLTGHGPQLVLTEMRIVGGIIGRLQRLPKPTIAAVDGVAIGVALGLAMACDLVIATDRARFSEVFVKRGLALDGGTSWTLPRLVGLRRAKQMTFFGDAVPASKALEWGLVNEVVAPEELASMANDWGRRLASGPTAALSLIKTLLDSGSVSSLTDALEGEARAQHIVYTTKDMREGIQAFLERREPHFTGE
jgi:2-(1,2-epoxy-1,2-dihydrophenyl)acetyl-CoA isomerase